MIQRTAQLTNFIIARFRQMNVKTAISDCMRGFCDMVQVTGHPLRYLIADHRENPQNQQKQQHHLRNIKICLFIDFLNRRNDHKRHIIAQHGRCDIVFAPVQTIADQFMAVRIRHPELSCTEFHPAIMIGRNPAWNIRPIMNGAGKIG